MQRGKYYFSVALRITTKALSARCDVDEIRAISFSIVSPRIPGEMYFLYFGMIAPSRKCLPIVRAIRGGECSKRNKLRREVKEFVLLFMKGFRHFSQERCCVEDEGEE